MRCACHAVRFVRTRYSPDAHTDCQDRRPRPAHRAWCGGGADTISTTRAVTVPPMLCYRDLPLDSTALVVAQWGPGVAPSAAATACGCAAGAAVDTWAALSASATCTPRNTVADPSAKFRGMPLPTCVRRHACTWTLA